MCHTRFLSYKYLYSIFFNFHKITENLCTHKTKISVFVLFRAGSRVSCCCCSFICENNNIYACIRALRTRTYRLCVTVQNHFHFSLCVRVSLYTLNHSIHIVNWQLSVEILQENTKKLHKNKRQTTRTDKTWRTRTTANNIITHHNVGPKRKRGLHQQQRQSKFSSYTMYVHTHVYMGESFHMDGGGDGNVTHTHTHIFPYTFIFPWALTSYATRIFAACVYVIFLCPLGMSPSSLVILFHFQSFFILFLFPHAHECKRTAYTQKWRKIIDGKNYTVELGLGCLW